MRPINGFIYSWTGSSPSCTLHLVAAASVAFAFDTEWWWPATDDAKGVLLRFTFLWLAFFLPSPCSYAYWFNGKHCRGISFIYHFIGMSYNTLLDSDCAWVPCLVSVDLFPINCKPHSPSSASFSHSVVCSLTATHKSTFQGSTLAKTYPLQHNILDTIFTLMGCLAWPYLVHNNNNNLLYCYVFIAQEFMWFLINPFQSSFLNRTMFRNIPSFIHILVMWSRYSSATINH